MTSSAHDAEFQFFFDQYLSAPAAVPVSPHLYEVRGEPVLSYSGATQSITRYEPWIGWLIDASSREEELGIEAVVRQACRVLGYNYCWVRDTAVDILVPPSGIEIPCDLHIPVYFGWHGEVSVEGQIFCVADISSGVPVRMMYPQERLIQPGLPVELWAFSDWGGTDRYRPINARRFFSEPDRIRPRLRPSDVVEESKGQDPCEWDEVDFMLVDDGADDLMFFDDEYVV